MELPPVFEAGSPIFVPSASDEKRVPAPRSARGSARLPRLAADCEICGRPMETTASKAKVVCNVCSYRVSRTKEEQNRIPESK